MHKDACTYTFDSRFDMLNFDSIRDFKIGHYGRLGRLVRCHVTQKTRDLLPSSFWDGMFSPGFSS